MRSAASVGGGRRGPALQHLLRGDVQGDREADEGGKNDWLNRIATQGYTKDQILDGFIDSQEFINLANNYGILNRLVQERPIVASISGKQIYIDDINGTFLAKFYSDGTYSEVWDDSKSGGNSGTCTGTWEVSSNFLNISQQCSVSSSNEFVTLVFNEQPAAGVTFSINVNGEPDGNSTITTFSDIVDTPTSVSDSISWNSWPNENPEYRGEEITNLTLLTNSFTDLEYSNWFEAADFNGNDIEVTLSIGGNVVNVSGHEPNGGALHGSTVLGSWTTLNNMINITMHTGEKIYIRLYNNNDTYIIQTGYIEFP